MDRESQWKNGNYKKEPNENSRVEKYNKQNLLPWLNGHRIHELADRATDITWSKKQREKRLKKTNTHHSFRGREIRTISSSPTTTLNLNRLNTQDPKLYAGLETHVKQRQLEVKE